MLNKQVIFADDTVTIDGVTYLLPTRSDPTRHRVVEPVVADVLAEVAAVAWLECERHLTTLSQRAYEDAHQRLMDYLGGPVHRTARDLEDQALARLARR